jgi:hypothetical protein
MKHLIPPEHQHLLEWSKPCKTGRNSEHAQFPHVEKINHSVVECDDCDASVVDRHVHVRQHKQPTPHWRRYCASCQHYLNPTTGDFDIPQAQASEWFKNYYKNYKNNK